MQLQINRQYVPILSELVDKEILFISQEINRHRWGFFEYKNGSYMMGLRDRLEILKQIKNRLSKTSKYAMFD